MTTLCNVAHPDILIFFYLCIYLFIDEGDGNGLAVGCAALKDISVDSSSLFHCKYRCVYWSDVRFDPKKQP